MSQSVLPHILPGPERDAFRATVAAVLDQALPPEQVRRLDESDGFAADAWEALAQVGAHGLGVADHLGGSGGGLAESLITVIEIARRYPSLAVDYVLSGMVARMLASHGTERQSEWLRPMVAGSAIHAFGISEPDGGTDALALITRADQTESKSWRVTGRKMWTSMAGYAELIFVLCRTDPADPPERRAHGISLIAVPTDQVGVDIRHIPLAGMRGAGTCEVVFDGAVAPVANLIGRRGHGMQLLRETLNVERILSAGISIGIGSAALDATVAYATERTAFDRPIGAFQALQHPLVDAATALAGAMLLTERALVADLAGDDSTNLAGMAKLAAAEAAAILVDRGMRTMAAMGLARESTMQMLFRDARLQLFSPVSNEMVRNLLGQAMGLPRSY